MRVRWVKVWVDSLATLTERFRDEEGRVDFEALGREEYAFRHALVTGNFSRSERARDLYDATINEITSRSEAGRKGAEARWSKNTAAAATSDGVDESTTCCNHSQEAPTRKAGDELSDARKGAALKCATSCDPLTADGDIREDSLNIHDTGDRGSLESGTSANHYDQEATKASTETLDKAGAGEVPPENLSAKPSPALPVPAKKAHGEFGNVMLTDDEFAKLCGKCADADSLITELDQYIESQGKAKKYKSHYATLLNWSRRKAQESKPKQGYMTSDDISKKNYEESKARLEAMFSKGRVTA